MSFIPKNPLSMPEIGYTPSTPPGTRGLFAKKNGWYEVDDKGEVRKISSDINTDITDIDIKFDLLKYYGTTDVEVTDISILDYTVKEDYVEINDFTEEYIAEHGTSNEYGDLYVLYDGTLTIPYEVEGLPVTYVSGFDRLQADGIILPNTITEIGANAFHAIVLKTPIIELPDSIKTIGSDAFYESEGSFSVSRLPKNLTTCDTVFGHTSVGNPLIVSSNVKLYFSDCWLGNVIYEEGVTDINIANGYGDMGEIKMPSTAKKVFCSYYSDYAYSCKKLIIPDNVEELSIIGASYLQYVSIGKGVKSIGEGSFNTDYSLSTAIIPKNVTSIHEGAFLNCASNFTVYCEQDSYAEQWAKERGFNYVYTEVTIDTEMSDTSENAVQNKVIKKYVDDKTADIYEDVESIGVSVNHKEDITQVYNIEDADFLFLSGDNHNADVRIGGASSITFVISNGVYPENYISGLSFDSGETPTAIDYTSSNIINWVGTDCTTVDGLSIFQPSANTHYDIVFYFNGTQFIGLVHGFVPATGNVVSE